MLNRKTIAAVALIATGFAAPVLADDGDVRHAEILLKQAQSYGTSGITGQAAGQTDTSRENRMTHDSTNANEKRWKQIAKSQSLN